MARTPPGRTREKVYRFVYQRLLEGQPPTVREVQAALGFRAVETARKHLTQLVREGRLIKQSGQARGYALPGPLRARPEATPLALVPRLGGVQAGDLTLAREAPDGYLAVQTRLPREELFALTVRGESMIGAGILPGDTVIVRRQATADEGEIVVALVGEEATVKRLRRGRRRIELHPENPAFEPIIPQPGDEVHILGRVVEVRRTL